MTLTARGKVFLKATATLVAEPAGDASAAVTRASGFVTLGLAGSLLITLARCKKGTASYIQLFLLCGINACKRYSRAFQDNKSKLVFELEQSGLPA